MTITKHEIRPGAYYDSVVLMQLQRALVDLKGVLDAGVVMGTATNLDLMADSDLLPDEAVSAKPDDLVIVVQAEDEDAAVSALKQVDDLISRRQGTASEFQPRSLESAAKMLPEAQWVLVSVPGRYAAGVARKALDLGRNVFLYSDNVSLEDEVELKQTALEKGLLVMGPDCGTAIINGIGLGFANHVKRGKVGLVGASGTGLQAVSVYLHDLGAGVSHGIGTGTRDLSGEVGAITAFQGIDLLSRDDETDIIVLVSKPPEPEVAAQLLSAAQTMDKPVVVNFIGYAPPARQLGNVFYATNLYEAAEMASSLVNQNHRPPETQPGEHVIRTTKQIDGFLRGLFSGGTLAYETMMGLQTCLHPLYSNVPIRDSQRLPDSTRSQAHTIVDMGADEFTVGRLHPMMDNEIRLRRLRQEAEDPQVRAILLDVVLGEGAHPDPASELAPAIEAIKAAREIGILAIVVGSDEDPQVAPDQEERLRAAGAVVFHHPMEAVAYIARAFSQPPARSSKPVSLDVLRASLAAINVGLESFSASLVRQGAEAVHVLWKPPAGGNDKLMSILDRLKG